MRVITEPAGYLLGRQDVSYDELDRFLADHGVEWSTDTTRAGEELAEVAGRTCYLSFARPRPGGNAAYLDHIKESGHGSVLEHAVFSFLFTGVSRSLTHELVRHRAGMAYSQLSQRYVDESVAEYVCPDVIAGDSEMRYVWEKAVADAHDAYVRLVDLLTAKLVPEAFENENEEWPAGISLTEMNRRLSAEARTAVRKAARQAARSVLPNATETKIFVTANARALRHFLEQRGAVGAEPEIRKLAGKVLDVLQAESPNLFNDYRKVPLPDGTAEIRTPYRKV